MNKVRRKALAAIVERMEKEREIIESLKEDLETLKDEEAEYLENVPENM